MGFSDEGTMGAWEQHHVSRQIDTAQGGGGGGGDRSLAWQFISATPHRCPHLWLSGRLTGWIWEPAHYCLFVFQNIAKEGRINEVMDEKKVKQKTDVNEGDGGKEPEMNWIVREGERKEGHNRRREEMSWCCLQVRCLLFQWGAVALVSTASAFFLFWSKVVISGFFICHFIGV